MDQSKIQNLNPQEYTHLPHADQNFEAHEQSDVAIRPLVATLIAIALTVVVSAVGLWGLFELFEYMARNASDNQHHSKVEPAVRKVPAGYPDLQGVPAAEQNPNSPAQDMTKFRQHNDKVLAGDEPMRPGLGKGLSIDEAMDKALASGVFKTAQAGPATRPSASGRSAMTMKRTNILSLAAAAMALFVCAVAPTVAQFMPVGGPGGAPQSMTPDNIVRDIGVDQKLDAQVSPDLTFKDETGKTVRLGDYFGKRPLMLTLVYYKCPGLCTMTLNGVVRALNATKFTPGKEFDVLVVSFDPRDTAELASAKKANYQTQFKRPEAAAGWHFLTGDQANIDALCQTVGFKYKWEEKFNQYAHASAIVMLTPQGRVSRYFFGLEYSTRDIELSVVEGSENRIGTLADAAMTFCFKWDESAGKYTLAIMRILRVAAIATVATLGTFLFVMFRRDRRKGEPPASTPPPGQALSPQ